MRKIKRRADQNGRIKIPKSMLKFFSGGIGIFCFNPIAVMCPGNASLREVERSLQESLHEVRRKIHEESLGSYITY